MEDNASESVVPSAEKCHTAYEKGFRIWQSLYVRAMQASGFPDTCFQFQQALLHQPYFPDDLNLELTYDYLSPCYIPPLERHLQMPVSIRTSTPLSISADLDRSHQNWFNNAENHLPVLAYNSGKPEEDDSAMVNIGVADDDATIWWAAILAPTERWEAYIAIDLDLSYRKNHSSLSDTTVSAAAAFRFLNDYCALHDIVDQAYAALSIVLLLPLLRDSGEDIVLPRPKFRHKQKHKLGSSRCNVQLNLAWPGIACNIVSPWLQAMFAVVNCVKDNRILTYMLMSRVPHLAFLWLGGAIVGIHKRVLQDGRFGLIPTEPHAALWSGTIQSFMQEPVHPAADNHILRSDKCRLLYLTQEEHHTYWPVYTEIDVRLHANCTGHGLQYAGFKWTCRNGRVAHQMSKPATAPTVLPAEPVVPDIDIMISIFGWLRVEGYPSR
ncbi:hypothetical protein BDV09DRAFT_188620 [Aspergillus tetrazonus]